MADRYTYLPHVGLLFAVSWSAARLARRPGWRPAAVVGSIAAVILCAAATVVQVGYWRTDLTLFTRALEVFERRSAAATAGSKARSDLHRGPSGALLHNYRGLALEDEGRFTEALEEFQAAEQLHPHHAETQNNIARSLERAGRLDEAIARYERAVANAARNAVMRSNLGAALIKRGDADRAADVLREALALDPDDAQARNNLGIALALLGDREGAERELRRALADRPGYADARSNLARLLREAGRAAEAEALTAEPPRERVP